MSTKKVSKRLGALALGVALCLTLASVFTAFASTASADGPVITTDQSDYEPQDTVTFAGGGFQAGETVAVQATGSTNGSIVTTTATADETGALRGSFDLPLMYEATYGITATGAASGLVASGSFRDSTTAKIQTPSSPVTLKAGASQGYTVIATTSKGAGVPGVPFKWSAEAIGSGATPVSTFSPSTGTTGAGGTTSTTMTVSAPLGSFNVVATDTQDATIATKQKYDVISAADNTSTTASNASATFGASSVTLSATVTDTANGATTVNAGTVAFTVAGIAGTASGSVTNGTASATFTLPAGTAAGGYTITANYSDGTSFNASSGAATLTVNPRAATVSADAQSKTYGDANPSFTATVTGTVNGDTLSFTLATTATTTSGVGGYPISVTLGTNPNYTVTATNGTLTVGPKAASVTPNAATKVYGTSDPALSGTLSGFLAADNVSASYSRAAGETVAGGPYTISATLSPAGVLGNYTITSNTAAFTITPASASVTPDAATKVYGTSDPALGGSLSGFLAADKVSASYGRTSGETVAGGPYTISATLSPAGALDNYTITSNTAAFTITPASASVTPNAATKVYGASDPALGGTLSGFLAGDNVTATYSRASGETVAGGPYTISATLSPAGVLGNYQVTYNTASFTITAASASVAANDATKTYGDANPSFTASVSGTVNGDTLSFTLGTTATTATGVGTAPITVTLGTNPNYNVTATSGTLTIGARAASVSANDATKTYGDANPPLTATVTGTVNGDTLSFTLGTTATTTTGVGTAPITVSLGTNPNYNVTSTGGTLTIGAKGIAVTVTPGQTKVYGASDPAPFAYTSSPALVSGDSFTGTLARASGENVGSYAIGQGTLSLTSNYTLSFTGGTFFIAPATLSITANNKTRLYGDANPTLDGTYSGQQNNETFTVTGSTNAGPTSPIGLYDIVPNVTGATLGNYTVVATNGTLAIGPATLTITANNKARLYGDANPAFDGMYSGQKNAETFTVSGATTAGPTTSVGSYGIVPSATGTTIANYSVVAVNGTLSITARPVTVTADAKTKVYGSADPGLTYQVTAGSLVNGDTFGGALTRAAGENVGTYAIKQGTLALSSNYALTYAGANLTITTKPIAVTANAQTKIYGNADPALTYTTSVPLVTGDAFTGALARDAGENVGTYAIKQGSLALSSNYALTFTGANLTVTPRSTTSTVTVAPTTQQYTGSVTFTATLSPASTLGGDPPATTVTFAVRGQTMGTATLTASGGVLTGSLTTGLFETVSGALAPGNAPVTATFGHVTSNYTVASPTTALTITQKAAVPANSNAFYTGSTVFWTTSTTSSTATLFLTATLKDPTCTTSLPSGYYYCDITKATVTFAVRNGTTTTPITGATNLPVGLANPSDYSTGTAGASVQYNLNNSPSAELEIAVLVNGYYLANDPSTDVIVSVSKPVVGTEFKFLSVQLSPSWTTGEAGTLRADPTDPYAVQVGGDVTYSKSGANPQGNVTVTVASLYKPDGTLDTVRHLYLIKSNAISTLNFPVAGTANFTGKASIQDLTTGASVDGGALIQVTVSNPVTPGTFGSAAIQVQSSKTGALWFSSAWNGTRTVMEPASSGVILVQ